MVTMNPMTQSPENMTRVMVRRNDNLIEFALYKDGMYEIEHTTLFRRPDELTGWMSIRQLKEKYKEDEIHTTIGVYKNGDYKINGVSGEHIIDHIDYNVTARWGRALFVNGECLHQGYMNAGRVADYEKKFSDVKFKMNKCTAPYH